MEKGRCIVHHLMIFVDLVFIIDIILGGTATFSATAIIFLLIYLGYLEKSYVSKQSHATPQASAA